MKTIQNIEKKEMLVSWNNPVVLVIFVVNIETFWNVTVSHFELSWINNKLFFVAT